VVDGTEKDFGLGHGQRGLAARVGLQVGHKPSGCHALPRDISDDESKALLPEIEEVKVVSPDLTSLPTETCILECLHGDSGSIYSWYSNLIRLRHENAALRDGVYVSLESGNRDVFAFGRKAGAKDLVLVVLNTSAKEQQVEITGMWPSFGKMLMASPPADAPISQSFRVAPMGY
jgi:Domain of unknown function (DUF3459)